MAVRYRETQRDLPSSVLLPNYPEQPDLGQAKA